MKLLKLLYLIFLFSSITYEYNMNDNNKNQVCFFYIIINLIYLIKISLEQ